MKTPEQIKQDVVNNLAWDSRVDASKVKVEVDDNTVKLTGTVMSPFAKDVAEELAHVTETIIVDNELEVETPEAVPVPVDQEIKDSVQNLIELTTEIDESNILIEVSNGVVTLEGSVPTYWEKTLAEAKARNVSGVESVTNKLGVVPTKEVSDEVIAERIMDRVEKNAPNVNNISVRVENGVVTLSGTVPSYTDWRLVYDIAKYTLGVTDVHDKLTYA